jgi:predicted DNA-binding transcriptional regulator AlpA
MSQIIGDSKRGVPPLIPVKKSCWWAGVKSGRFPKPVKIGNGRGTFWRVEDIRTLIASA